jgi:alpha-beta hydrolase superfamily lysophospholipase
MINLHNDTRAPLLLVAGGKDHISPPAVVTATQRLYKHSSALTEYKEYPERTHYTLGQEGWEQVADDVINWALKHARVAEAV